MLDQIPAAAGTGVTGTRRGAVVVHDRRTQLVDNVSAGNVRSTQALAKKLRVTGMSRQRELADQLGVSAATVSRALNDKPGVSTETRCRVVAAAREMDYRPNAAARALTTATTRTIAFAVHRRQFPLAIDPFYPGIMRGLEETLAVEHYGVMLLTLSDEDIQAGPGSLPVLQEGRVDALVAAGPDIPPQFILAAASGTLPVVLVDNALRETAIPTVTSDDSGGCRAATCHLVEMHGHTSIALLRGTPGWVSSDERAAGYCEAMDATGLEPRVVSVEGTTIETGAEAFTEVLKTWPDVTAVVAVNDAMAIGAIRRARELGREVPDDLAVVGFDDISWAELSDPPLTTVRVPIVQIGRRAGRVLLDHFDEVVTVSSRTTLATELVVRASCGCAPSPRDGVAFNGGRQRSDQL